MGGRAPSSLTFFVVAKIGLVVPEVRVTKEIRFW